MFAFLFYDVMFLFDYVVSFRQRPKKQTPRTEAIQRRWKMSWPEAVKVFIIHTMYLGMWGERRRGSHTVVRENKIPLEKT